MMKSYYYSAKQGGALLALILFTFLNQAAAAEPTGPGVQVSHTPSPNIIYAGGSKLKLSGREIYIADPAIEKLPDGSYVMAHSLFGNDSTTMTSPVSKIFRSSDNGRTWALMKQINGFQRGSFFVHDHALYLIGSYTLNGDGSFNVAILKSTDSGATWSTPTDSSSGILISGNTGTTKTPQIYNNRVWISLSTSWAYSAALSSDLMNAASWTRSTPAAAKTGAAIAKWPAPVSLYFGGTGGTWSEAQIVVSPEHGATVMPKIQFDSPEAVPHTVLFHISKADNRTMSFDPGKDFVPLTGSQKKFGATYDAVSGRYYALTNTVLHADKDVIDPNSQRVKHELIRNTATLVSSADLHHWDVEKIFIHARDAGHVAWQYFTFIVDGNDLAIASRTAFKTAADQYSPPRGHDSNLLTFHRLENFRAIAPAHYLKIEAGAVNRYETTHYEDAPLGSFAVGHGFSSAPNGLAQAADGTVYVRESTGGIIKSFDAHGNYLGQVSALPAGVTFTSSDAETLAISQPPPGSRNWTSTAGGDWYDPRNWYYWNRPDTERETATFGTSISAAATVTLAQSCTLGALHFRSPHSYTIAEGSLKSSDGAATYDTGALTLKAASERPLLAVHQGRHTLAVPLTLPVESDMSIAAGSALAIDNTLALQASLNLDIALGASTPLTIKTLTKNGAGTLIKINITGVTSATPAGTKVMTITGAHNLAYTDFHLSADAPIIHAFVNNTLSITPVPPPVIASFPPSIAPGETVTIAGANFSSVTAVLFNGLPAGSFTINSPTQITATAPLALAAGGAITLRYGNGFEVTSEDTFIIEQPPSPAPQLSVDRFMLSLSQNAGGTASFTVTSNIAWTCQVRPATAIWPALSPANGAAGLTTVTLTAAAANTTGALRDASIVVSGGNIERTINVVQHAAAAPGAAPATLAVGATLAFTFDVPPETRAFIVASAGKLTPVSGPGNDPIPCEYTATGDTATLIFLDSVWSLDFVTGAFRLYSFDTGGPYELDGAFTLTLPPAPTYKLTVVNATASGSGSHEAGATITLTASAAPDGKVFDKWTSTAGGAFANANAAGTTFTMPPNATTVAANYKEQPATPGGSGNDNNNSGGGGGGAPSAFFFMLMTLLALTRHAGGRKISKRKG